MTRQREQLRSCPQCLVVTSRPRVPLKERHNVPARQSAPSQKNSPLLGLAKSTPNEKFLSSLFPCPTEPVPDAPIDYTELWKAVSMAKQPGAPKSESSNKGTEAYDNILHRLGIDIRPTTTGNPEDVIDLSQFQLPQTVEYPNLSTDEQLQAFAKRYGSITRGMNEATLAARIMQDFFVFEELPDPNSLDRSNVPCQILELWTAFTNYDQFNKDLYTFVRGPKKERVSLPQESDLRSRSDLTFMAHVNAIGGFVRDDCRTFPGVHSQYDAIAPFLSIEFKVNNQPAKVREATHQIAASSFVNLVERQRLSRPPESPYIEDKNIRHYAYTICGNVITVWCTTLQKEEKYRRSYTTYQVQRLRVLNLAMKPHLEEFLKWHRHIMTWGLAVYVTQFADDIERAHGGPKRLSLVAMILSAKKVTQTVNSDGIPETDDEIPDGGPDHGTEDLDTEDPTSEALEVEVLGTEALATEGLRVGHIMIGGSAGGRPKGKGRGTEYPTSESPAIKGPAIEDPGIEVSATEGLGAENLKIGVLADGRPKGKGRATEYTLPRHRLNAAAMLLSKTTDRELVKAYLIQLLDDINQLNNDTRGTYTNIQEKPGECAPEGNSSEQAVIPSEQVVVPSEQAVILSEQAVIPSAQSVAPVVGKGKRSRLPLRVGSSVSRQS